MGNAVSGVRSQDVLILLKLISWKSKIWRQVDLAAEIGLSQSEVANALERLRAVNLIDDSKKKVYRLAAIEFLIHALRYIVPASLGSYVRGMPTAHSAKPISDKLFHGDDLPIVWPYGEGHQRGISLDPIHPTAPMAAERDSALYELLAIVDSLRIGSTRERKAAEEEIRKRILKDASEDDSKHPHLS